MEYKYLSTRKQIPGYSIVGELYKLFCMRKNMFYAFVDDNSVYKSTSESRKVCRYWPLYCICNQISADFIIL